MAKITLGEMIDSLRRSYLKDIELEGRDPKWDDDDIRDFIWAAMDTFAHHTAVATSAIYTGATGIEFELPDNLFEKVEDTGLVYIKRGTSVAYLKPMPFHEALVSATQGFYTMPEEVLHLASELNGTYDLVVHYFAYYNRPYALTDTIDVPRWAYTAISYLATAHALTRLVTSTANIRRFADKRDSGQPEHNPILRQREHLLKEYEREITRHLRQNRTHFWKVLEHDN